jgi:signal peptidase I
MPRSKSLTRTILEPIAIALALGLLARAAVHIYSIPSESMLPTLVVGDQIVVTRYFGSGPERGDIVVFRSDDELLVKRVIAVPGDLVDSRLGRVRIGGYTVPEPYVLREAATGAISSQLVPPESYFVLGDNRDDSLDSRSFGFVARERIVGRARMILWSSQVDTDDDRDDSARAASAAPEAPVKSSARRTRLFKWLG